MDNITRREIIMDNYQHPMHKGLVSEEGFIKNNTRSDSCIDNIDLMLKIEDGIIKDAYFDGEACAICTSATSIIIKTIIGKTVSEANNILKNFENMINELEYDELVLKELTVYDELYLQPSRKNCALLPKKAAAKILEESEK